MGGSLHPEMCLLHAKSGANDSLFFYSLFHPSETRDDNTTYLTKCGKTEAKPRMTCLAQYRYLNKHCYIIINPSFAIIT